MTAYVYAVLVLKKSWDNLVQQIGTQQLEQFMQSIPSMGCKSARRTSPPTSRSTPSPQYPPSQSQPKQVLYSHLPQQDHHHVLQCCPWRLHKFSSLQALLYIHLFATHKLNVFQNTISPFPPQLLCSSTCPMVWCQENRLLIPTTGMHSPFVHTTFNNSSSSSSTSLSTLLW